MSNRPRVIVGVAPTMAGLRALRLAIAVARRRGAVLHAVRVYASSIFLDTIEVRERLAAGVVAQAFADTVGGEPEDVDVVVSVLAGRPERALTAFADRDSDLLIVGVSRRPWWRRLCPAIRTVAGHCMARSVCPVQAVPPDTFARDALRDGLGRRISRELSTLTRRPDPH